MSEATRKGVLDRMKAACLPFEEWESFAVVSAEDKAALDAHVADERRRAVAAEGCEGLRWEDATCAEITAQEQEDATAGRVKVLAPHEPCAPCRAQAEIDAGIAADPERRTGGGPRRGRTAGGDVMATLREAHEHYADYEWYEVDGAGFLALNPGLADGVQIDHGSPTPGPYRLFRSIASALAAARDTDRPVLLLLPAGSVVEGFTVPANVTILVTSDWGKAMNERAGS